MIHHEPPYPPETMYVSQGRLFWIGKENDKVALYEVYGSYYKLIAIY
jgi:hypothetical protein